MKILIPSYDFKPMLGGVANYAHEVASHLVNEHQQTVTVIARKMSGDNHLDQQAPYNVERILSAKMAFVSQKSFVKKLISEIPKHDIILCPLWFPDAMSVYIAQKILRTQKPVFIAVHASELFDVTNSIKTKLRHLLVSPLQKNIFKSSAGILAVSQYTKKCVLQKMNLHEDKVHAINNGVNLKAFSPPLKKSSSHNFRLLTLSRLQAYKGVDVVLKSLVEVIKVNPHIIYTVAGTGPDSERLKKMTVDLGLTNHVHFTGTLEQKDILDLYQNHDLFVMMSRYEHPDVEGFGLVFLEAAACKLTSIGGDSGGIPDAITNDVTGWLMDPIDEKSLAKKLLSLMANPEELHKKNEAAWKAVQTRSWSTTCAKIWKVLNENK